ncbi:MAG: hypothetical protein WBD31_18775 [Rubripirellula sp.]
MRWFTLVACTFLASFAVADEADRETRLANYLTGSSFVGKFTVDGKEDKLPKTEQYTISKCEKMDAADQYRLTARIKYGEVDSEVPMEIKILWSGQTPVITLDSLWIPGMGTFDARVMIHAGRYAGTWQHDKVGGHMFGKIVVADSEDSAKANGGVKDDQ